MVGAKPVTSVDITAVDITAADMLMKLDDTLRDIGIDLYLAEMKDPVKDKLNRFGVHSRPRRGAFLFDDQRSRGRLPQNSPSAVAGLGGPTPVMAPMRRFLRLVRVHLSNLRPQRRLLD